MNPLDDEIDISESESEDEALFEKKSSLVKLSSMELAQFSIDNLLKERENDESYHEFKRSKSFSDCSPQPIFPTPEKMDDVFQYETDDEEKIRKIGSQTQLENEEIVDEDLQSPKITLFKIGELSVQDASIFNDLKTKIPFPEIIYQYFQIDLKQNEEYYNEVIKNQVAIPGHILKLFFLYPTTIPPSIELFYAFACHITSHNICDNDSCLMKYSQRLNENSINYSIWRSLFIHAINHSPHAIYSLFSVCNYYLFGFASEEEADRVKMEIIMFYFGMIMTTDINTDSQFPLLIHYMRSCLLTTDFDQSQIDYIVALMIDLTQKMPIELLASILSTFPIDGAGAPIMFSFTIKLIFILLGIDYNEVEISLPCLAEHLKLFQNFFEISEDTELQWQKASAVLALLERAIMAGFQMSPMDHGVLTKIIQSLKVNLKNIEFGAMTLLKEQIHATRSQLEMIQLSHDQNPSSNLFF